MTTKKSSKTLLQIYEEILAYCGMKADEAGYISAHNLAGKTPIAIEGKSLVMPLKEHLLNNDGSKIIFHPLCENIMRGESAVLAKTRQILKIKINTAIADLGLHILSYCLESNENGKFNPEQSECFGEIGPVDENTKKAWASVAAAIGKSCADKGYVNIFLKQGGKIGERKYSRVGIVTFPLYEELSKSSDSVYGVKLRVKDREAFKRFFEMLFPLIKENKQLYDFGSISRVAPFLESLLNSSSLLVSEINNKYRLFSEHIEHHKEMSFDTRWADNLQSFEDMLSEIRSVPMQAGNDLPPRPENPTEPTPQSLPWVSGAQPQSAQPPIAQQNMQQPVPQQHMPVHHNQMQQPMMQQPMMQQPPAPSKPVVTNKGVDFKSLISTDQSVNQAYNSQMQQHVIQPIPHVPRWAMPQQPQQPMQQYPQQMMQQPMQQVWPNGQVTQYMPQPQPPMQQYPQQMMQQPMQYPTQGWSY